MPLPTLQQRFAALLAAPSVSCTQPALDQSNRPVVELLAGWLEALGFACELQEVQPGKFNLLATRGQGPGGLVLAGQSDTVPYDEALWRSDPLTLSERDGRWTVGNWFFERWLRRTPAAAGAAEAGGRP